MIGRIFALLALVYPAVASGADCSMPGTAWSGTPSLQRPAAGLLSKRFGLITQPLLMITKMHQGVDFDGATGDAIVAAASGTVVVADARGAYGKVVRIDHGGGWQTAYAHLAQIDVVSGSCVAEGQRIGGRGSTGLSVGPHLHFEVIHDGKAVDPAPLIRSASP